MDSGKFGPPTGSPASGDDRFGYFGGTASAGGVSPAPVGTQFGGPPASANPTAGAQANTFGSAAATTGYATAADPLPGMTRPRWLPVAAAVVVAALVGGGAWYWTHRDALVLPSHLGALTLNTGVTGALESQVAIRTNQGDLTSVVGAYGPTPAKTALVVARGNTVANNLPGQAVLNAPGVTHYGSVACAAETGYIMCMRAEGDLVVVVQTGTPGVTETQAAGYVEQAWDAQ